jgi:hypothetical protein
MCGTLERLTAFGERTFQVISQQSVTMVFWFE